MPVRNSYARLSPTDWAPNPPPSVPEHVVATYYFAFRSGTLAHAVEEISYHATSGIKNPPKGSLLEQCSARQAGVDAFDASGRIGLLHVAFPLKMMRHPDGHLTSCDLLHTLAGAVIFDMYENQDARLIAIQIPDEVVRTFPGPAYGPINIRKKTGFALDQPAFGTILKPTAGITPADIERLVGEVAGSPLLMFIKEDEDLYPDLDYSPVAERTRRAVAAIERTRDQRGGLGLVFSPHVSAGPNQIVDIVLAVVDAGATGVMFSETYAGGTVRMVREATKNLANPPAIYGHNAGIGTKTRAIWREVIDFLARLDGIDFRQTAPVRPGSPYIRPYGAEWQASEEALTRPVAGINPTMITRAGARPREPDLEPSGPRIQGHCTKRVVPRGLGDQHDTGQAGQAGPAHRAGCDVAGDRGSPFGRAERCPHGRPPRRTGGSRPPQESGLALRGIAAALSGESRMIAKDERCLRIGVLGCGPIAQFAHLDACRKAKNAELYAICDLADDLRQRMLEVHRPQVAYADYDVMLEDPRVEAVIIAVADEFHVPAALKAIAAGKHVLVEKPLGTAVEPCRALCDQAAATKLIVQIGNNRRFDPGIAFAHDFIAGEMGQRMALKSWYYDSVYRYTMTDNLQPIPITSANARRPEGDPKADRRRYYLLTHGSHLVDTARFLGGPIVGLRARSARAVRRVLLVYRRRLCRWVARSSRSTDSRAWRFSGRVSGAGGAWQRDRPSSSPLVPQSERRRVFLGSRPAVSPDTGRGRVYVQAADRGLCRHDPGGFATGGRECCRWLGCRAGDGGNRAISGYG